MFIEDVLHFVVDSLKVHDADLGILSSISRQVKKGTGLTDRQYQLVKQKLETYRLEFEANSNINFDEAINSLRLPIREIDRRQYIQVVSHAQVMEHKPQESSKQNYKWIEIRFPFSKKNIVSIEKIAAKYRRQYYHVKGSHQHFFRYFENILFDIVDVFKNKNFEISEQLLEQYELVKQIKNNKDQYVPGFVNNNFVAVDNKAKQIINNELGEINESNLIKLYDRRKRYGLVNINCEVPSNLTGLIVSRQNSAINIDPKDYNLDHVVESLLYLDRFPILVLIDTNNPLGQLIKVYNAFSGVVSNEKQSVLFRVDNDGTYNLNNFVQDKQLNNWVDKNTEIVYICKNKLPKLLLKDEWQPLTVLSLSSDRSVNAIDVYTKDKCDCIIYHDSELSLFSKLGKSNGFMQTYY